MNQSKKLYEAKDHTFVICTHGESPHLREAVDSIMNQSVLGKVFISTACPNKHVESIASDYGIEIKVNNKAKTAAKNWNSGYNAANTSLVTIAHQDDIYRPSYLAEIIEVVNRYPLDDVSILFSDYCELYSDRIEENNKMLKIKRIMNKPFVHPLFNNSCIVKRGILAFGNPICCPTVTINKKSVKDSVFSEDVICSFDYMTWINLASKFGRFVYIPKQLLNRRIHKNSGTTEYNESGLRQRDDKMILDSLWPKPLANIIAKIYSLAEKENKV